MKKFAVVLLLIVLTVAMTLTGCGKDREDVLAGFNELLPTEAFTDIEAGHEKLAQIEKYLDDNLKYVDTEDADYMIFQYMEEAYKIDNEYISYQDLSDRYSAHLSDFLNALFEIEILEESEPLTIGSEGGRLSGDWSDIAERALLTEELISEHKETINSQAYEEMKEHVLWHYEYYINLMLIGTSWNPLFSYETGEFDENVEDTYISIMQQNPDSVVAWALNEYFTYLDSIRYQLDYKSPSESMVYYDTCNYIKTEAGKRVFK